jgi:hypothetical protein
VIELQVAPQAITDRNETNDAGAPRVQAQLKQTVLQFPAVTGVAIFINGKPLRDVLSLKG